MPPSTAVESEVITLQILICARICLFQNVTSVSPNLVWSDELKYGTVTVSGLPQFVLMNVPMIVSWFCAVLCCGMQRLSPSGPRASDATNEKTGSFVPFGSSTKSFERSSVTEYDPAGTTCGRLQVP